MDPRDTSPAAQVLLLREETIPRPYTILQTVYGWGPSLACAETVMKRQAARIGADAIMGTQYRPAGLGQPAFCSGRAIRYKPLGREQPSRGETTIPEVSGHLT